MRRLPLIPTLLVLVAVPVMLALGAWQLRRAEWKADLLARLAANADAPVIDLPASLDDGGALSFRRARVSCERFGAQQRGAARSVEGRIGYRVALLCIRDGGDPVLVSTGIAVRPQEADGGPMPTRFVGPLVQRSGAPHYLMIAETPVPPLAREAPPSPATIPNNHLGYAVQWFAFAVTLVLIYGVYVRRWRRER